MTSFFKHISVANITFVVALRKPLICVVLTIALLFITLSAKGKRHDDTYSELMKESSKTLIDKGHRCAEVTMQSDSALVCFTIVASRYNERMTKEEQQLATVAYIGKWFLYFFRYFDYAKAFENLSKARDISWRIGYDKARVLLNFGCMYQTLAEQNDNRDLNRKAYNYYCDAFRLGIKQRDKSSAAMAFANLIYVAFSLDSLNSIERDYQTYLTLRSDSHYEYNRLLYQGLKKLDENNYADALAVFEQQYATVKGRKGLERFCYLSILNQSRSLVGLKRYAVAIEKLEQLERMAVASDMKDAKLEVYRALADCHKKAGEEQASLLYRDRYFSLKDTLMNYQQVASVSELHFLNEMKQLDEQLQQINRQRHAQNVVIVIVLTVAIVFALFLFVIYRKNKLLRKKNEALYLRSLESIEKPVAPSMPQKKYQNSTLNEDDKEQIMERVLNVMDTSEEIFSPDFNVERLAQLTESKSKQVSQVINEKYNDNFNSLVNKYRIREACRRLSDTERYGQYTIDAISKSVGFRSRNTFVVGFRRFTGLTPSEYQRIAKDSSCPKS